MVDPNTRSAAGALPAAVPDDDPNTGSRKAPFFRDTPVGHLLQQCADARQAGALDRDAETARYWYEQYLAAIEQYPDDPETPTAIFEAVCLLAGRAGTYDPERARQLLRQAVGSPHVKPSEKALMLDRLVFLDLVPGQDLRQAFDDLDALAETIDNLPENIRPRYYRMLYSVPLRKAQLLSYAQRGTVSVERLPPELHDQRPSEYYREYLDLYHDLPPDVRADAQLPSETTVLAQLARALVRENEGEQAAAIYRELRDRPDCPMGPATTIKLEAEALDPSHGKVYLETLKQYEHQYANDPEVRFALSYDIGVWSSMRGDAETCINRLEPLLSEMEADGTSRARQNMRPTVLYMLGRSYASAQVGDHDTAIEYYVTLIEEYPDAPVVPAALHELATLYEAVGDSDAAAACRDYLMSRHPDSPQAQELVIRRTHEEASHP